MVLGRTGPDLEKALGNIVGYVTQRLQDVDKAILEATQRGYGPGITAPLAAESATLRAQLDGLRIQQATLPIQQAMRVSGALAGGWGTVAGAQTAFLGSYGATASSLQSVAYLEKTAASASEQYERLKSVPGVGGAVLAEAWQEATQAHGALAQARLGLAGFSPSPETAERLGAAEYGQGVLSRTFASRGSVRGMVRERMGALDQMASELTAQMQRVLPSIPAAQRPAVEHAFNEQLRQIGLQQVSAQQELEQGWMERLTAANWNMPGSASLVLNELNFAGAVMKHGIRGRHLGATSQDLMRYQQQPLGGTSYGGAGRFGTPLGFVSSALSGITQMSGAPDLAGAAPPVGGAGVPTTRTEVVIRIVDERGAELGRGTVDLHRAGSLSQNVFTVRASGRGA